MRWWISPSRGQKLPPAVFANNPTSTDFFVQTLSLHKPWEWEAGATSILWCSQDTFLWCFDAFWGNFCQDPLLRLILWWRGWWWSTGEILFLYHLSCRNPPIDPPPLTCEGRRSPQNNCHCWAILIPTSHPPLQRNQIIWYTKGFKMYGWEVCGRRYEITIELESARTEAEVVELGNWRG